MGRGRLAAPGPASRGQDEEGKKVGSGQQGLDWHPRSTWVVCWAERTRAGYWPGTFTAFWHVEPLMTSVTSAGASCP